MDTYTRCYDLVHPGHGTVRDDLYENHGGFWSLPGLRTEDYLRYAATVHTKLGRYLDDPETLVVARYRDTHRDTVEQFLGDLADDVDVYVPTSRHGADPVGDGEDRLRDAIDAVADDGTVRVAGELTGLCHEQALEQVDAMLAGTDTGVERGVSFPGQPLKNRAGQVYWADAHVPQPRRTRPGPR